ncbi:hypothetical protein [Paracoccus sp. (in: a-proteobacteria)]|uniref:hypothetical protein n=1 Tax=Paracoccus sp. TaxID=267 RepID=UPI0028A87949|nr:hypothetical protein [Paracoccus sp. (in: a-proteobacteria)]
MTPDDMIALCEGIVFAEINELPKVQMDTAHARSLIEMARKAIVRRKAETWQPIQTAPKDGTHVLGWFDHDADPHQDSTNPNKLTAYAAWAESGDFLAGSGVCIAYWLPRQWESTDDYGDGYWQPAAWFVRGKGDYEMVVNITHWMPLREPPARINEPQEGA